ncbi:TetR/AcrR family transcriptional regulator [Azospirillum sp. RWY-5-1]|uniref:TetR/AcrR family transcriptional regulator n=1 Tax=Azospirillum oleiclasticum TaxID=2735135 RepID=A0ABX2TEV7_9PROT|nr:TetR/AcrR family transcriptional regulator [Azospirillum oleiclasticum]NYZ14214.1 TetR/AcrR family transcriptional regulator [Azospirillum oleiclasticum]NYZ21698.1 TetR/AcrR family transcriptional regulator [Azospirillum oleiclasticum]
MATDPSPRWRRRKEARPQEITAAALELFAERGFAASRLDDVAARAGISKGTLYLYFPNKEELFKAVVRDAVVATIDEAERLAGSFSGGSFELLEMVVRRLAGRIVGTRAGVIPKLILAEAGNFPELARFYHDEVARRGFATVAAVLRRGIERGEFRPVDARAMVPVIIGPLLLASLWKSTFEPVAAEPLDLAALLDTHLDHLRRSLAADAPKGGPP